MLGCLAIKRISHIKNVRFYFSGVIVLERHQAGGRGVVQHFAADMNFMVCDLGRRLGVFVFFRVFRIAVMLGLIYRAGRRSWAGRAGAAVSLVGLACLNKETK